MATLPIDNGARLKPTTNSVIENFNQTDKAEKINQVGNTPAITPITETAIPPTQELEKITNHLNNLMKELKIGLNFEVNQDDGELLIKVVDTETKEIIRQIPGELTLHLRKTLDNKQGIIFQTEA
jgi:flagellar protein FlaG